MIENTLHLFRDGNTVCSLPGTRTGLSRTSAIEQLSLPFSTINPNKNIGQSWSSKYTSYKSTIGEFVRQYGIYVFVEVIDKNIDQDVARKTAP